MQRTLWRRTFGSVVSNGRFTLSLPLAPLAEEDQGAQTQNHDGHESGPADDDAPRAPCPAKKESRKGNRGSRYKRYQEERLAFVGMHVCRFAVVNMIGDQRDGESFEESVAGEHGL